MFLLMHDAIVECILLLCRFRHVITPVSSVNYICQPKWKGKYPVSIQFLINSSVIFTITSNLLPTFQFSFKLRSVQSGFQIGGKQGFKKKVLKILKNLQVWPLMFWARWLKWQGTWLLTGWLRFDPGWQSNGDFLHSFASRLALWPTQLPVKCVSGLSQAIKMAKHRASHSTPSYCQGCKCVDPCIHLSMGLHCL